MNEQSHAYKTPFVYDRVELGSGEFFYIDGNSKITACNGTFDVPKPNAFSLVEIADCPFRTSLCEDSCYVHGLKECAPGLHSMFRHNSVTVQRLLPIKSWFLDMSNALSSWIESNCTDFRWHVSGDIFSYAYAEWIAQVCRCSPGTRHWIYTRSVPYLEPLKGASNLVVNLSADAENYPVMRAAARAYGFRICYLTVNGSIPNDLPPGSVIFPDYDLRGRSPDSAGHEWFDNLPGDFRNSICPADFFGKSKHRRCGPCDKCMVKTRA